MSKKLDRSTKEALKLKVTATFEKFKTDYPGIVEIPQDDSITKIESLGIFILIAAAPEKISGFCMAIGEDTFIFINKNHTLGRQNYSLWHEVYHWYTGTFGSVSIGNEFAIDEIEYSAEYFASLVLIDAEHLKGILRHNGFNSKNIIYIKNDEIIKLQHYFKVSYSAMVNKLVELFPEAHLSNRYALGSLSKREELVEKTLKLELDLSLIENTTNSYITPSLFEWLSIANDENRISKEQIERLVIFIEEELI